ncbi:hypothetical protein OOU_Y34scaffold00404g1 [Pyricularia oryzae Y34]|uniref:Uncharacterized protein n=1 Tax=Pyricularia oryzae (strain Y34) TaxID=1143189 RepID=A0AA97P2D5_PYRO3|nr:hypothetical protein OOU_Y34scaffold00404g1 [Pyricularia oryzae Y34]
MRQIWVELVGDISPTLLPQHYYWVGYGVDINKCPIVGLSLVGKAEILTHR